MKPFIERLKSDRYSHLVEILFVLGVVLGVLLPFALRGILDKGGNLTYAVSIILALVGPILFGCAGFVGMIRQGFGHVMPYRGKAAQIIGLFLWISCWGLGIYILVVTMFFI